MATTSESRQSSQLWNAAGRLWSNHWLRRLAFVLLALEVFMLVIIPAFRNTFELIKARAAADAAELRVRSESEIGIAKLQTEIEAARNAAEKMRSDAQALDYQAGILRQKSLIALETARQSARHQSQLADKAMADNDNRRAAFHSVIVTHFGGCRGRDDFTKLDSAAAGRC